MFAAQKVCWGFVVGEMTITGVCLWASCHYGFARTQRRLQQRRALSASVELHLHDETTSADRAEQVPAARENKIQPPVRTVIETMNYWAVTAEQKAWLERPRD